MKVSDFSDYMKPGKRCHLIGIGGVSMSLLAEVLLSEGVIVTGSEMKDSETVKKLRNMGINIVVGHSEQNINGAECIVRTAAAHEDNPEIIAARKNGIPVFERSQAWGFIMKDYNNAICVSGTHGKTTATSMVTHILMAAEKDPTVMIGGTLPLLKSGYRLGNGETIVLESDEYYNSFHNFFPTIAIILNIDEDHPDFFPGIEDIKKSFRKFAGLIPETGYIIANGDDENTCSAIKDLDRKIITFGIEKDADFRAVNIQSGRCTEFDIYNKGEKLAHIKIRLPGRHIIYNALAAAAAASVIGITGEAIEKGLSGFTGACRRLEYKGEYNGADIYDDFAHHPTELRALLQGASQMGYDRVICVFQPHTYTRTKALFNDFAAELKRADIVMLAEIYPARETDTLGISSKDLAEVIADAEYFNSFDDIVEQLKKTAVPGDIILTVGAGDIYRVGEKLTNTK